MKRRKLIIFISFISFFSLFLTSCSSYSELNNVMIVDSIGIDKVKDEYIVSFNTYVENGNYEIHTIKEKNLNNIFNSLYLEANKRIYLSHLNILFLSSNLENSDIINIINTFNKRNDLRGTFNVILMHNYDAKIFNTNSERIIDLLENNENELGIVTPITFNDLVNNYLEMNISYIPILDSDLKILGMHSILDEYRFYNPVEAMIINILMQKINTFSITINDEDVKFKKVDVCYNINKNNILINLNLLYQSNLNKKKISEYLENNIYNLLNLDINQNYFINLIKKKDYSFYKNNSNINIKFDLNIKINKEEINNMKDGDLIEEN